MPGFRVKKLDETLGIRDLLFSLKAALECLEKGHSSGVWGS